MISDRPISGSLNIAVIGCGPGGMTAALFLSRQGHHVTLFERFIEPQPLGSGLLIQPSGQYVLDAIGVLREAKARAESVDHLHGISAKSNRRALDMQYRFSGRGTPALGIHRASLFDILMNAVVKAEIRIETGCRLVGVDQGKETIMPLFQDKKIIDKFDLLVDATGARSPLANGRIRKMTYGAFWATVDMPEHHQVRSNALDQRYWRASKMAGIMPIGNNPATGNPGAAIFWSEKPENADAVVDAGIDKFRSDFCELWPEAAPFVAQLQSMDDLTMAIYAHRTGHAQSSSRIIHIGDSWHCTSPQLGQGANMALLDAFALSEAIRQASNVRQISKKYRKARSFHIQLYQALSVIFTPLYQSNGKLLPLIRDLAIHYLARLPLVRTFIAKTVSGMLFANIMSKRL